MHAFTVAKKGRREFTYQICSNKARRKGCKAKRNFRYDLMENAILEHMSLDLTRLFRKETASSQRRELNEALGEAEHRLKHQIHAREALATSLEEATPQAASFLIQRLNVKMVEIADTEAKIAALKAEIGATDASRASATFNSDLLKSSLAAASPEERYPLRARLSAQLREHIRLIEFDPEKDVVRVVLSAIHYLFGGNGTLIGVFLPRPALDTQTINDWAHATGSEVTEEGDMLLFSDIDVALMFKLTFHRSDPSR